MKPRKIRRHYSPKRRNPYRHRQNAWKTVGAIVGCIAIVVLGVLAGKLLFDGVKPPVSDTPSGSTTSSSATGTTTTTQTPPTQTIVDATPQLSGVKAFYLPHTALNNTEAFKKTLADAKKAGFNGVVLELKDSVGRVYFQTAAKPAKDFGAVAAEAVSKEQLQTLLAVCEEQDMLAVGYLYAFYDRIYRSMDAIIEYYAEGSMTDWLDNAPGKGKTWLNPYKPAARSYLVGLGEELQELGFTALIYDGVQFPFQRQAAFFDSSLSNQLKPEMAPLQAFVEEAEAVLSGCQLSICCTGAAATGTGTDIYGSDNPLKLGSQYLSPLLPATGAKTQLEKIVFRAEELETDSPALLPWLTVNGLNAKQIQTNIGAVGDLPYVLYNPTGSYDFTALSN